MNTSAQDEVAVAVLSKELGMSLPASIRVLGVERQEGMDDIVRAKLEMPRAVFEANAKSLPLEPSKLRPGVGRLGTDRGFWNPGHYQDIRSGSAMREGARAFHLGIASRPDDTVVVFIVSHGT